MDYPTHIFQVPATVYLLDLTNYSVKCCGIFSLDPCERCSAAASWLLSAFTPWLRLTPSVVWDPIIKR